jgi:hypothetical protein
VELEDLEKLAEGVVREGFLDVGAHQVCEFLVLEEETQLSEKLKVPKDVDALHELEAFLEVDAGLHVQVLVVREEPSLMTVPDDLQVAGIFENGGLLNELNEALDDFFSVEIVVHGLEPFQELEDVFHGEDIELRIIVKEDVLQAVDDPLIELMEA